MIITETKLAGCFSLEVEPIADDRGFFARRWCVKELSAYGMSADFVQSNLSFNNKRGTIRGMHYQLAPYAESKLVSCLRGAIFDIVIDLREESPTFKESFGIELSAENRKSLYIPKGFAHGYQTLTDDAEVAYLVDEFYNREYERGLRFNDPAFKIVWPITSEVTVSERDQAHPNFTLTP